MRKTLLAISVCAALAAVSALGAAGAQKVATSTFGDGTYRVGKDIAPHTYRAPGGDGCYWERLRSFSGTINAIIANANPNGPTIVTIARTDRGFKTARCGTWTSRLGRITKSKVRFGEGTYIANVDVAPGTYRSGASSGCYWARLKSFGGTVSSIIANDNPTGRGVVTISRRDRGFESHRCGTWSRF